MSRRRSAFGSVIRRKGRPGFYVRVRIHGHEVLRWGGPDRKTATEVLGELLRASSREHLFAEKAIAAVSFAEFEPILRQHLQARHAESTLESEGSRLSRVVEWFGPKPLREITVGDVEEFLSSLRNERMLSTAATNRYTALLSVAFHLAVERGLARTNPAREIRRPREQQRPVPFLGVADVDRLVAAAGEPRFAALVRILADTGLRRGEALALEWRDVDLGRRCITIRKSKNHRPRQVELTSEARAALAELHRGRAAVPIAGPDRVWPDLAGTLPQATSSRFKTIAKRVGMETLRLHDLRHAFCSRLAQAGVPLPTIAALAGHKSQQTTARYSCHLPERATEAAIRAMESSEQRVVEQRKVKA